MKIRCLFFFRFFFRRRDLDFLRFNWFPQLTKTGTHPTTRARQSATPNWPGLLVFGGKKRQITCKFAHFFIFFFSTPVLSFFPVQTLRNNSDASDDSRAIISDFELTRITRFRRTCKLASFFVFFCSNSNCILFVQFSRSGTTRTHPTTRAG